MKKIVLLLALVILLCCLSGCSASPDPAPQTQVLLETPKPLPDDTLRNFSPAMRSVLLDLGQTRQAFSLDDRRQRLATANAMLDALEKLGPLSEWSMIDLAVWHHRLFDYGYCTPESLPLVAGIPSPRQVQEAEAIRLVKETLLAHGLNPSILQSATIHTSFDDHVPYESRNSYWTICFTFSQEEKHHNLNVIVDAVTGEVDLYCLDEHIQALLDWLAVRHFDSVEAYFAHYRDTIDLRRKIRAEPVETTESKTWEDVCLSVSPHYRWTQADYLAWEQFLREIGAAHDPNHPEHVRWEKGLLSEADALAQAGLTIQRRLGIPKNIVDFYSTRIFLLNLPGTDAPYWHIEYQAPYTMFADIIQWEWSLLEIDASTGEVLTFSYLTGGSG